MHRRAKGCVGLAACGFAALCAWQVHAWASDGSGFPDGYDAVQAAPDSHKVIFENALVRVLEVTVPRNGQTEPMHHHHQPGGIVGDSPGSEEPIHAGHWVVRWMQPEPMHAIESVENERQPGEPPLLRVEIKVGK